MLRKRCVMGFRTVALMYRKTVLRKFFIHFQHQVIPGDLSQHRCRGNAGAEAIPMYNRFYRNPKILFPVPIDQRKLRLYGQLRYCPFHCQKRRLQYVDLIDPTVIGKANTVGDCLLPNDRKQFPTLAI